VLALVFRQSNANPSGLWFRVVFFFITLKPRVERYTTSMGLKYGFEQVTKLLSELDAVKEARREADAQKCAVVPKRARI